MRDEIEQTRRLIRSLDRLIKQSGDRQLPTEILNRALVQVMRNQVLILSTLDGRPAPLGKKKTKPTEEPTPPPADDAAETDAGASESPDQNETDTDQSPEPTAERADEATEKEADRTERPTGGEQAEQEEASEEKIDAAPPGDTPTEEAQDDDAGIPVVSEELASKAIEVFELDKLLRWLEGGTLFQLRGEFAFVKASSFSIGNDGTIDQTTETLRRLGYATRLGRLDVPEITECVILYRNPGGGKRSWDE